MTLTPRIIRIPDITEDDLATLWVGTEENMRLRGPARNALGQGPFSGEPVDTSARAVPAAGTSTGGAVTRISTSPEVESDRAARAAEGEEEEQPEPRPRAPQQPVGAPPPTPTAEEQEAEQPPAGPAIVRLVPSKPLYQIGETVVVQVVIDNAQNVGSTPFHLRYNTEVLQYVPPGAEGPFMSSDGSNTVFLASDTGGGGEIVVGLSRMGAPQGATGAGTLAVFQFQAVAAGDCGFAFTGASVKDPQARNLPAAFNTAAVRVE